jgi:hypothetical protein
MSMCSQIVHIIIIIYQKNYVKINLNTILTNKFQSYLLPTFIIKKLLEFFIQSTTNPMDVLMVLYFYFYNFFIYFLCECQELLQL